MAGGTGRRRHTMLLFTVLAGLFLMHGLGAPSMHVMPVQASAAMPAAKPSMPMASPMAPPQAKVAIAEDCPDQVPDHMRASMTCVPLRPEGMPGLFVALFLIATGLWRPRPPLPARRNHPRWPHGPPRTGIETLRTLSISRT